MTYQTQTLNVFARKSLVIFMGCLGMALGNGLFAEGLQMVPSESKAVFGGSPQNIEILLHNTDTKTFEGELQTRLYQLSSATRVPVGEPIPWKKLQVLPGQTILESFPITLPEIRATTRFQIRLLDSKETSVGTAEVTAYPPNLLTPLKTLAGEKPMGIVDPHHQIDSLLREQKMELHDLMEAGFESFDGKLILAVFAEPTSKDITEKLMTATRKGARLVWIQPATDPGSSLAVLTENGDGRMVRLPLSEIKNLSSSPTAQLRLIRCVQLLMAGSSSADSF